MIDLATAPPTIFLVAPAEKSADKYHGVSKFDIITGAQSKPKANAPSYTKVFAQSLIHEAEKDDRIVATLNAGTDPSLDADKESKVWIKIDGANRDYFYGRLEAMGLDWRTDTGTALWIQMLLTVAPFLLIILIVWFLIARSMRSFGMLPLRPAATAERNRGFCAGSGAPIRAATSISRASLANNLARFLSCAPLRCMMFLNWEWPAMARLLSKLCGNPARLYHIW